MNVPPDCPFIYMRDGKTYYQGEEHFLKTVNYLISVIWDADDNIVIAPHANYSSYYAPYSQKKPVTQEEANSYLRAHFKMIKDMGLNSIRVMNCAVEPRWDTGGLAIVMLLRDNDDLESGNKVRTKDHCEFVPYLQYENIDNQGMQYYKQAMQIVLDIAKEYDLKVIWVSGVENRMKVCEETDTTLVYKSLFNYYNNSITVEYANFLTEISSEFREHSSLFAFDLCNEPESFENEEFPDELPVNKESLANCVKLFNSSIKENARNHYTTIGVFGERTFFKQGVKPFYYCDFISFHLYNHNEYLTPNLDIGIPACRYLYYWNRTVDHPWIIGENGTETPIFNEICHEVIEGGLPSVRSETEQKDEVEKIMNFSAACGAISYTYWNFGNERDWQNFGLIKANDGSMDIVINESTNQTYPVYSQYKEIVSPPENSVFNSFNISSVGACSFEDDLYMDIFDNADGDGVRWTGNVVNQNGNSVADAIVRIEVIYNNQVIDDESLYAFYTFTDDEGHFSLNIDNTDDWTAHISAAKYGYEMTKKKNCPRLPGPTNIQIDSITSYPERETYEQNIIVSNGETLEVNYDRFILDYLTINNGGTLIVKNTIYFDSNATIIINPGGKLILENGATLTAIKDQWQGIQISGEPNNPAEIHTSGNTTIAKAIIGLTSNGDVIVDIDGTKFINNAHDIDAVDNDLQIKISNSYFNTAEGAYNGETEGFYTNFDNCADVVIENTEFVDYRNWEVYPKDKIGIDAKKSNILVTTDGLTSRNTFQGLEFSISVEECELDIHRTDFHNNMHDIFLSYGQGVSIINDCSFTVSTGYPIDDEGYNYFVHLCEAEDVRFRNCDFSDNSAGAISSPLKFGIWAYNVGNLEVTPDVLVTFKRSSFTNLSYGINASKGIFSSCQILVKQTDFKTSRGIYLGNYSGFGSAKILNNDITVMKLAELDIYKLRTQDDGTGTPPDPYEPIPDETRPYGIYIDGISNLYQVEGNSITSENGDGENKYGIVLRNNGATMNTVYRNDVYKLENSVQAIGNNKKDVGSDQGLQILCNKFNSNKTDIYVTSCNENNNWGIAGKQGGLGQPAGNLFSCYGYNEDEINCPDPVINNDLNEFTYYTRNWADPNYDEAETPGNVGDNETVHVTPVIGVVNAEDWCLNNTIDNGLHINTDEEYDILFTSFAFENSIDQMLDDIVDGGSTGQVISDIIHLDDNSAWITYYDLLNKSPYLSDTVLKNIAKKETGLTVPMIRDILVANPQSAKKSDVKKLLKDRDIQLPDYMIEQIEAGEVYISSKEYLELQKFEQRIEFEKSLFTLANYYYNSRDSLPYAHDSLVSLFSIRKEPKYLYILADYYVDNLEYLEAKEVLNSMHAVCDLTDIEAAEVQELISFITFYKNLFFMNKDDLYNLNDFYIEQLKVFEDKGGIAGAKASQLLYLNNVIYQLEEIYKPSEIIGTRSFRIGGEFNPSNPTFAIYPNPASDYLTVDYKLAEQKGTLSIVVVDIAGKPVYSKQLNSIEDIVLISLKDIPPGTYICSLFNGNDCDFSEKFVINK